MSARAGRSDPANIWTSRASVPEREFKLVRSQWASVNDERWQDGTTEDIHAEKGVRVHWGRNESVITEYDRGRSICTSRRQDICCYP